MNKNETIKILVRGVSNKELLCEALQILSDNTRDAKYSARALSAAMSAHHSACSTEDIACVVAAVLISDEAKAREFLGILAFSGRIGGKEEILLHGFILGILHAFILHGSRMTSYLPEFEEDMLQRLEYLVFSKHGGGAFPESLSGTLANSVAMISARHTHWGRHFLTVAWRKHSEEVLTPLGQQVVNEFAYKMFNQRLAPIERARAVAEFLEKKAAT